jgi:hypothetical protein
VRARLELAKHPLIPPHPRTNGPTGGPSARRMVGLAVMRLRTPKGKEAHMETRGHDRKPDVQRPPPNPPRGGGASRPARTPKDTPRTQSL